MIILGDAVITPLTQAQQQTEAILDGGLDFPVQSCIAFDGKHNLPVWTNGDGVYFAIARDGELIDCAGMTTSQEGSV